MPTFSVTADVEASGVAHLAVQCVGFLNMKEFNYFRLLASPGYCFPYVHDVTVLVYRKDRPAEQCSFNCERNEGGWELRFTCPSLDRQFEDGTYLFDLAFEDAAKCEPQPFRAGYSASTKLRSSRVENSYDVYFLSPSKLPQIPFNFCGGLPKLAIKSGQVAVLPMSVCSSFAGLPYEVSVSEVKIGAPAILKSSGDLQQPKESDLQLLAHCYKNFSGELGIRGQCSAPPEIDTKPLKGVVFSRPGQIELTVRFVVKKPSGDPWYTSSAVIVTIAPGHSKG